MSHIFRMNENRISRIVSKTAVIGRQERSRLKLNWCSIANRLLKKRGVVYGMSRTLRIERIHQVTTKNYKFFMSGSKANGRLFSRIKFKKYTVVKTQQTNEIR